MSLSILYVTHGFPPETWAGTEVYTLNLALEMQARGHRVCVLTRSERVDEQRPELVPVEDEFAGLRVIRLPHALAFPSLRETYDEPRVEQAFSELLARERFDVVHFQHLIHLSATLIDVARAAGAATLLHLHDFWGLCARVQLIRPDGPLCPTSQGLGCLLCVKERGYRAVPWVHRLEPLLAPGLRLANRMVHGAQRRDRKRRTWLQKSLADAVDVLDRPEAVLGAFSRADLLVSPSRFVRDKLCETGRFDPQRVLHSPNGMRTDHITRLERRPDPGGRLRIGFIGTLVWYKGVHVLLEAMLQLRGLPALLQVHGPFEPERDAYHRQLAELAGDNVEFRGRFDNARLGEVHAGLDVLVVPSIWYENSPVTIHEAWLAGTPLVVSRLGGMAELVVDDENGLSFEPGDARDLARVLARFSAEPELGPRLAAGAPPVKTAREDAEDTERRYLSVISCSRGGR